MTDQITFRGTDATRWGAGQGSDLTAAQVDINFWVLLTAVQALQSEASDHAAIDNFVIAGNQLFVHLTNHVVLGPFTLPMAQWRFRNEWTARTGYTAFDVFTNGGAVYLVLIDHVSNSLFAAGSNDGNGHSFYGLLLAAPPKELPQTGETGQLLQWQTSPGDVRWQTPSRNIAFYLETAPDPVEIVLEYEFTELTTFAAGLTNCRFSVRNRPTGDQEFDLFQDGGPIGSVTIHPTGDPTVVFNHQIDFSIGDIFAVVGPVIQDNHMSGVRMNFVGTLH